MSEPQAPYNAADPQQVKRATRKAKKAQDALDDHMKALLELPQFRMWIWNLVCDRCQLFQSPFNPNGSTQTLNIGRQDVGRELLAEIERIDPAMVPRIMAEYAAAREHP